MKSKHNKLKQGAFGMLGAAALLAANPVPVKAAGGQNDESNSATVVTVTASLDQDNGSAAAALAGGSSGGAPSERKIQITALEPVAADPADPFNGPGEATWLGVATEEAPEVLASQLGLDPGVGLVVTYVTTNSPAARAGLEKNDVLVEFAGQPLVLPAQLRKLVHLRKEGDEIKLAFYRAGKKHIVSATLAKTGANLGLGDDGRSPWPAGMPEWPRLQRAILDAERDSMRQLGVNGKELQIEIRRSMDAARKSYQDALQQLTNADLEPLRKALESLKQSKLFLDDNAAITVRSSGKSAKSLVKADESGTIVIVSNPKLRLTAHDKDGKLLFDGEIETEEQRAKVPADLWKKAEPLVNKINSDSDENPGPLPAPAKKDTESDSDPFHPGA